MLSLQRQNQDRQNAKISQKLNKNPIYSIGQLVYLYKPTSSSLTANSKKIAAEWCGPLVIHQVLDRTHYILATLKGEIIQDVYNYNRLKPCFINASSAQKNITHIQKLKEALGHNKETQEGDNRINQTALQLQFLDEQEETLPMFNGEHAMCLGNTEPLIQDEYISLLTDNKGIAAKHRLTKDELRTQFDLIMTAPVDKIMTMHRARFKTGQLQILVSFKKPQLNDKMVTDISFWWNIDKYSDTEKLIEQVLMKRTMLICGTPRKMLKNLFM